MFEEGDFLADLSAAGTGEEEKPSGGRRKGRLATLFPRRTPSPHTRPRQRGQEASKGALGSVAERDGEAQRPPVGNKELQEQAAQPLPKVFRAAAFPCGARNSAQQRSCAWSIRKASIVNWANTVARCRLPWPK